MECFWTLLIFLVGAAVGSFLSVIANRFNTGLSYLKGRSFCFSCNTELKKKDLFPIFSFLFLKGRCRYCKGSIPRETILTEIFMGVLLVLSAYKSGFLGSIPYNLEIFSFLNFIILGAIFSSVLLITIYDLKHFIIPDAYLVALFIFSIIYLLIFQSFGLLISHVFSGILLALPFLLIFLASKGVWMGFGDVKYILAIGFFLGLSMGVSAIVLSFWIGAFFSLLLILLQKLKFSLPYFGNNLTIKSEIPFGPFLSLGLIISFCINLDLFQINALLPFFN